jgi:hypothetical protein
MRRAWLALLLLAVGGPLGRPALGARLVRPTGTTGADLGPGASAVNSTIVVDTNFAALLTQLGISGTST